MPSKKPKYYLVHTIIDPVDSFVNKYLKITNDHNDLFNEYIYCP